eukprot:517483-Pleurochrysis_carterae.AAC.1
MTGAITGTSAARLMSTFGTAFAACIHDKLFLHTSNLSALPARRVLKTSRSLRNDLCPSFANYRSGAFWSARRTLLPCRLSVGPLVCLPACPA